jgi:hypothetical protein
MAGILLEKVVGEDDKLRGRQATALAAMGKIESAINLLEEALLLGNRVDTTGVGGLEKLLAQQQQAKQNYTLGLQSLEKGEFTRAKRLFQVAQVCHLIPRFLLHTFLMLFPSAILRLFVYLSRVILITMYSYFV